MPNLNPFKDKTSEPKSPKDEIKQLRQQLRKQEEDAQTQSANDAADIRRLREDLQTARNEIRRVSNEAETEQRRAAQEHAQTVDELNQNYVLKLSKQEREHEVEKQKLQHVVDDLNEAWLNRDDEIYQAAIFTTRGLPHKPDDKIRDQVLELQRMVDELARIDWKPQQEAWMDRVFQRAGNQQYSPRSLKKAIVQDLIWSLLFRWIFCSPFRIFGEEGKKLEQEWQEQCGKGEWSSVDIYNWPAPGVKTERWRYMTMKECREILTTPIPSHVDKRAEVKRGFKTYQDELFAAMETEIGTIVQLTSQENRLIEKLAKKAASTWLDFAMHRCRIVIRPTGMIANSTADRVSTIQRGSLALTVFPAVGRYGTVRGMELDRFTAIKGCEGTTLEIA